MKGSAFIKTSVRPVEQTDIEKVMNIIRNHNSYGEYEFYICGSVVEGLPTWDIDVACTGPFNKERIYYFTNELTQQVLTELGIELDILYYKDISWISGVRGCFSAWYGYSFIFDMKASEIKRNRVYFSDRDGMLNTFQQEQPTKKAIDRNYDLKNILKV